MSDDHDHRYLFLVSRSGERSALMMVRIVISVIGSGRNDGPGDY